MWLSLLPTKYAREPRAAQSDGALLYASAVAKRVTPTGYEIARAQYLKRRPNACEPGLPKGLQETRCGELASNFLDDCGTDTLCPRDEGYVAPDEDGSELDGTPDYFWDCGRDRICPPPFDTPEEVLWHLTAWMMMVMAPSMNPPTGS